MTEITLALQLAEDALNRNRWAKIHAAHGKVILEIGPVKSDGSREHKSATYRFYTDADGIVRYVTDAHP
jgi:hypothetical protein